MMVEELRNVEERNEGNTRHKRRNYGYFSHFGT